ncbi:XdhC family protein [Streptomyces sp. NPDC015127]|uniref:XdhC family protein n=1 Tax=Streptomyces sp. NPDC015127 TaxID=3364939 RepID=UPI0036FACAB0
MSADGDVIGSVSGGCAEAAVYELCRETLESGGAPVLTRFGYSDSDAFAVGLTCGGEIEILTQRVDPAVQPHLTAALAEVVAGRPAAVAQVVGGPRGGRGERTITDGVGLVGTRDGNVVRVRRDRALCRSGHEANFLRSAASEAMAAGLRGLSTSSA